MLGGTAAGVAVLVAGGVGVASAGPDTRNARTIVVQVPPGQVRVIDLGPKGESQADLRIANGALYSKGQRIGRFDIVCVETDPEVAGGLVATQCTATWSLPGGQVTTQAASRRRTIKSPPLDHQQAITGGTGTFRNARGQVDLDAHSHGYTATFRLLL